MARTKTKGVPILFRPPIHISDALIKLCNEIGTHPNAYVERLLIADIEPRIAKPRGKTARKVFMGGIGNGDE